MDNRLYQIRSDLERAGVSQDKIEAILTRVQTTVAARAQTLIQEAVSEAVSIGESMNADGFLEQICLSTIGQTVSVSTDSGETNFSSPPFPMLPFLLKHGKTSSKGDTYKVIPVGKPSNRPPKMLKDTKGGLNALNNLRGTTLEDMAQGSVEAFNYAANNKIAKQRSSSSSGPTTFRTASSRQDPSTSWVIPARSADMTPALVDINARLHFQLSSLVQEVLDEMEGEIDAVRDV